MLLSSSTVLQPRFARSTQTRRITLVESEPTVRLSARTQAEQNAGTEATRTYVAYKCRNDDLHLRLESKLEQGEDHNEASRVLRRSLEEGAAA